MNGKEYSLLFSLNALDAIQEKFGGYDKLSEVFNSKNPSWIKDTKWLLMTLINEGILAEDENATTQTEQQIGRMVHAGNLKDIQQAIFAAFATGTAGDELVERTDSDEDENEEDTEGNAAAVQEN